MKPTPVPMTWGEIRIARKHLNLNFEMPQVIALFQGRYTAQEIEESLEYIRAVKRAASSRRCKRSWREINKRRRDRESAGQNNVEAGADAQKRRLVRANNKFIAAMQAAVERGTESAQPHIVTEPGTKSPRTMRAEVRRFGNSVLSGI